MHYKVNAQAGRIAELDVIRGFALLGVLIVNAPFFAAPIASVINPALPPLASEGSVGAWWGPHVFFEFKCITLFSMLFGASVYLVGGERSDKAKGSALRRRLGWLALFGLLHGALLWFGDILFSYAVAGAFVMLARSWNARTLLIVGLVLFAVSLAMIGAMAVAINGMPDAQLNAVAAQSWSPPPEAVAAAVARYRSGFNGAFAANLASWIEFQLQTLIFLTPRTLAMMMIGLGLFKLGFLSGARSTRVYAVCLAVGCAALCLLGWRAASAAAAGWPIRVMQGEAAFLTAAFSPLVSLGYASGLILILRARVFGTLARAFAAVGRMAFTNYIAQSVVLSTLFWGGRGFGLYGEVSRVDIIAFAGGLFAAQTVASMLWLKYFDTGPLEAVWRRLSQGGQRRTVPAPSWAPVGHSAIESEGLSKNFGATIAVEGVNLHAPAGSVYGFLGANGAGKTTTIRLILGLLRPSAGAVRVFGHDVERDRLVAARETGSLLEARATYDHLSGRDNLELTRRMLGVSAREIDRVLEIVDLRGAAKKRAGFYSLGMRQRLGLARALIGKPRLLVLDEPMNGLDPDGIADMRRLIRTLPEQSGVTVFLSSHLLSEVEQTATHIGLMRQGRLVLQGGVREMLNSARPDLFVRATGDQPLIDVLTAIAVEARCEGEGVLVPGCGGDADAARIARVLIGAGLAIIELSPRHGGLEALYARMGARRAA